MAMAAQSPPSHETMTKATARRTSTRKGRFASPIENGDNPAMTDPDRLLRDALAQHQAGALAAACTLYQQVLAIRPMDHDALHLMGVARAALGDTDAGITLIQQAITLDPGFAHAHYNLGHLLTGQGQPAQALPCYLACLAVSPDHLPALTATARTLQALGRWTEAIAVYQQALVLAPADPATWSNLGTALSDAGRLTEALQAHDEALRLQPDYHDAHYNRGCLLVAQQQLIAAEAAFRAVLRVQPDHAKALFNLGLILCALVRPEDAVVTFRHVLDLEPDNLIARIQRGLLLNALNRPAEAIEDLTAALHIAPDNVEALAARGGAFWALMDWQRATADVDRSLALDPAHVPALINRGNLFQDRQQYDQALDHYDRALAAQSGNLSALINRGGVLQSLQRHAEAILTYEKALVVRPGYADAELNIGLCQLRAGNWRAGWQGYEARQRLPLWSQVRLDFKAPPWDGRFDISGKRVLVVSEQGFGDTIQFSRLVRLVAQRGATVILGVQTPLRRLISGLAGASEVVADDEPTPPYDLYVLLMSLPALLDLGQEAAVADSPYLQADPAAVAAWQDRLAPLPGLKIGLAWAGDPRPHDRSAFLADGRRSITLARLAPLLAMPGATFVSLQKGPEASQAVGLPIVDWTPELNDFADTAALIQALDLVISVDTAVVHVAGALGRPVWVLNRFDRCWRWMWDRTDTPWYPTMRLFTQTTPGQWDDVVAAVLQAASGTVQES